MHCTMGKLVD